MRKAFPRQRFWLPPGGLRKLAALLLAGKARSGEEKEAFERAFAEFLGVPHALAYSSSRAGIYHALRNLDLAPGDEVICQSYTFFVVPAMIRLAGLQTVFTDVDPKTYNLVPEAVEAAVTPRSRVLVVTHLHGVPAPLEPLLEIARKHGLRVIEDCAHATGLRYRGRYVGTHDIGCFSLGVGKNLSTLQGGMLATTDPALADRLRKDQATFQAPGRADVLSLAASAVVYATLTDPRLFRWAVYPVLRLQDRVGRDWVDRAMDDPFHVPEQAPASFRIHMSNLQAAMGLQRLQELPRVNAHLERNARAYTGALPREGDGVPQLPPEGEQALYMHYTLRSADPRGLRSRLLRLGIDTQLDYCRACAELPPFGNTDADCPVSRSLEDRVLFLPNYPDISEEEIRGRMRQAFNPEGPS